MNGCYININFIRNNFELRKLGFHLKECYNPME